MTRQRARLIVEQLEERRAPSASMAPVTGSTSSQAVSGKSGDSNELVRLDAAGGVSLVAAEVGSGDRGQDANIGPAIHLPFGPQIEIGVAEIRDGNLRDIGSEFTDFQIAVRQSDDQDKGESDVNSTETALPGEDANAAASVEFSGNELSDARFVKEADRFLGARTDAPMFDIERDHSIRDSDRSPPSDPPPLLVAVTALHGSALVDGRLNVVPITTQLAISDNSMLTVQADAGRKLGSMENQLGSLFSQPCRSVVHLASDVEYAPDVDGELTPSSVVPDSSTPGLAPESSSANGAPNWAIPSISASDIVSSLASLDPKSIKDSIARFIDQLQAGPSTATSWMWLRRVLVGAGLVVGVFMVETARRYRFAKCIARLLRRREKIVSMPRLPEER